MLILGHSGPETTHRLIQVLNHTSDASEGLNLRWYTAATSP